MRIYGVGVWYDEVVDVRAVFSTEEKANAHAEKLRAEGKAKAENDPRFPWRDDVDMVQWELDEEVMA